MQAALDTSAPLTVEHELRFASLFQPGHALSFPCDAQGRVDIDALNPRSRGNYFYARAMLGREFAAPVVLRGGAR